MDTATLELESQVAVGAPSASGGLRWAWLLVALGLILVVGGSAYGYTAHTVIARINVPAQVNTQPALAVPDIATNGRALATPWKQASAPITRALEQRVLTAPPGPSARVGAGGTLHPTESLEQRHNEEVKAMATITEKVWTEKFAQMSHGRTRYWEAGQGPAILIHGAAGTRAARTGRGDGAAVRPLAPSP
jgi:hypothetical protein